ncbi:hypothetical protein Tco_0940519 [Tanacetum coccineum]|uniref:Reverse transcriptase domain-containing protein n=1 Tax=Tanacetum coccineum TaxID=301880 RepID=A0ABQ5DNS2_9ASTR
MTTKSKARRKSPIQRLEAEDWVCAASHSDSRIRKLRYIRKITLKSEDSEGDTGNLNHKGRSPVSKMTISPNLWYVPRLDPFTSRIRHFDFPKTQMPSHVKTYNGSEDPEDHLKIFQASAKTKGSHIFPSRARGGLKSGKEKSTSGLETPEGGPEQLNFKKRGGFRTNIIKKEAG